MFSQRVHLKLLKRMHGLKTFTERNDKCICNNWKAFLECMRHFRVTDLKGSIFWFWCICWNLNCICMIIFELFMLKYDRFVKRVRKYVNISILPGSDNHRSDFKGLITYSCCYLFKKYTIQLVFDLRSGIIDSSLWNIHILECNYIQSPCLDSDILNGWDRCIWLK